MKILILGAGGMLGHKLMQLYSAKYDVLGTVRQDAAAYDRYRVFPQGTLIGRVDADDFASIERAADGFGPTWIVNCIGVIKQLDAARDPLTTISINSLLPHRLAKLCSTRGIRLIHISTDCVFSGSTGMYKESDTPDPVDLYGRTKLLGEVTGANCLTLRTSIIGRELSTRNGLLEWFLQPNHKEVRGFRRAIYSGLTTIELARVIESVMHVRKELTGVYHVSSDPINKYDLLLLIREAFGIPTSVVAADTPSIDRSLASARFRQAMAYTPPPWTSLIAELAQDQTPYPPRHLPAQQQGMWRV
ncbi:MAG TPA: SDR family oxidoreductase [Phycisphaerae bacterium]|nr:SDR family oxidoreductase [Phycisphaerae bacterium]HRY70650.1 SDR family oxidoreductase [Phycisphaerae bacterium]HSA28966.1 SDR family oxidoreductase [Phycisphaerae bacterium]